MQFDLHRSNSVMVMMLALSFALTVAPAAAADKAWLENWQHKKAAWRALHLIGPQPQRLDATRQLIAEFLVPMRSAGGNGEHLLAGLKETAPSAGKGRKEETGRRIAAALRAGVKELDSPSATPPKDRWSDKSGKLAVTVSEPLIISSRITRPELGAHEQPHLFKMPCGDIHLVFHKDFDIDGAERVILKSSDKGKTWTPLPISVHRHEAVGCLRDGTVLVYDDYAFRKEGTTFVGQMCVSKDGGKTFGPVELTVFQRPAHAATRAMQPGPVAKYRATSARWSDQLSHALWRSVLEKKDGTLLACAHAGYQADKKLRTICYHSTDKGKTWGAESTVACDPTIPGEGFVEPVMSFCSNGDVLCVMRTNGHLPLMQARSTDGGKTWQKPAETGSLGVDPDLCLMSNGVLACSYGRPGNRIMFSADGTGRQWTDRIGIYEYKDGSFGYTGIVEVEPGRLLFVYDRHDVYPEYEGRQTTAIQGVYITVRRK